MSAYIVSKSTIDAIVTYAVGGTHRVSNCRPMPGDVRPGEYQRTTDYTPTQIGAALWAENARSVNYRYREDASALAYTYRPRLSASLPPRGQPTAALVARTLTAMDLIKLCQCLEFQSCEHPGWKGSFAQDFLDRTIHAAISELPGHQEAPWGLPD